MFLVETAYRSDLLEILSLQKEAYLSEAKIYNDYNIPPLQQTVKDIESEFENGLFLKIKHGGLIIGSVRAYKMDGVCHIGKLIVRPDQQNQGIGTILLREIESRFPSASAYELFTGTDSIKNLHIYQKQGYTVSYQKAVSPSLTMVFLRKDTPRK